MFYSVENGNDVTMLITEDYIEALEEYESNPEALELWKFEKLPDGEMGDCAGLILKKEGAND